MWYSAGSISVIGGDRSIFVFTDKHQCFKSDAGVMRRGREVNVHKKYAPEMLGS